MIVNNAAVETILIRISFMPFKNSHIWLGSEYNWGKLCKIPKKSIKTFVGENKTQKLEFLPS